MHAEKILSILIGISLCVGIILGVALNSPSADEHSEQLEQRKKIDAKSIVDAVVYVKDEKTGLCFAYVWGGLGNGGPALTNVPCDKVVLTK